MELTLRHKVVVAAGFTLVVALAATLSCSYFKDEGVSVKVTKKNYCSEIAEAVCENVFECCTGAQIENQFGLTISTSKSKCRRDVELICEQANPNVLHALEKGTVTIDEEAATECLKSAIVDDVCFDYVSEIPLAVACQGEIIKGNLSVGQQCIDDIECLGTGYCGPDRKCRSLPGVGKECDNTAPQPCDVGLYCNETFSCEPLRKGGEECDGLNPCAVNLYCDDDPDEDEDECRSLKGVGAACRGSHECTSAYCIPGLCSDGSQCFEDDQCVGTCESTGGQCSSDEDCDGTCQLSGMPCQVDWDCTEDQDKCIHPTCEVSCMGKPVCGEKYFEFDYCTVGLGLINGL